MHWLELHIDTTHDGLDPVTALLSSLGIDNVMIDDEEEFRSFLEETRPHWDYVDEALEREMRGKSRVTFYLLAGGGPDRPTGAEGVPQRLRHTPAHAGKRPGRGLGDQLEAVL